MNYSENLKVIPPSPADLEVRAAEQVRNFDPNGLYVTILLAAVAIGVGAHLCYGYTSPSFVGLLVIASAAGLWSVRNHSTRQFKKIWDARCKLAAEHKYSGKAPGVFEAPYDLVLRKGGVVARLYGLPVLPYDWADPNRLRWDWEFPPTT